MPSSRFIKPVAFFVLLSSIVTLSLPNLQSASIVVAQESPASNGAWLDSQPVNWNRRMSGLPRHALPRFQPAAGQSRRQCARSRRVDTLWRCAVL
jgi:hypothetical protein